MTLMWLRWVWPTRLTELALLLRECQVPFTQGHQQLASATPYVTSLYTAEQELCRVTVDYESLPGWKSSTAGLTSFSALPPNAQAYVRRIEQLLQVPSEEPDIHVVTSTNYCVCVCVFCSSVGWHWSC